MRVREDRNQDNRMEMRILQEYKFGLYTQTLKHFEGLVLSNKYEIT